MLTTNVIIGFLVIFVCVVLWLLCSKYSLNSFLWLIAAWSIIIFLYFFSGIEYAYKVTNRTWGYVLGSFFVFFIFYWIGYHDTIRHKKYINGFNRRQIKIKPLFYISLCGMLLYIFDIFRLNEIQLGNRNLNLHTSGIGSIGAIFAYLSLFIWLYEVAASISSNKLISVYGVLALIIYLFPSVIVGGRQSFIICGVSSIILLFYSLKKYREYKYKLMYSMVCALFAVIFIVYNFLVLSNRELGQADKEVLFYEAIHNAELDLNVEKDMERLGNAKPTILQFLFYYSHELPSLAMVVEEYDSPYSYGAYQFHYVARRMKSLIGDAGAQPEQKLEEISKRANTHSTSYRTILGDIIIDYGLWGGAVVIGLIGFFMGKSYKSLKKEESIYELVIQCMLCAAAVFSIEYSPLREIRWAYPFFWAALIRIYVRYI